MLLGRLDNDWHTHIVKAEREQPYWKQLEAFLQEQYAAGDVYPAQEDVFQALRLTPYAKTKVVLLGQDPYHGEGQAHGLSFSVRAGTTLPPSLRNIFKELRDDLGCPPPVSGDLTRWAEQGVLLLNTVLTVSANRPGSHQGRGWESFTDRIIQVLHDRQEPVVFVLWGKHAQSKRDLLTHSRHLVITSAHPSPLSARRGFFGSRPFSKINDFLRSNGSAEIDWLLHDN